MTPDFENFVNTLYGSPQTPGKVEECERVMTEFLRVLTKIGDSTREGHHTRPRVDERARRRLLAQCSNWTTYRIRHQEGL